MPASAHLGHSEDASDQNSRRANEDCYAKCVKTRTRATSLIVEEEQQEGRGHEDLERYAGNQDPLAKVDDRLRMGQKGC